MASTVAYGSCYRDCGWRSALIMVKPETVIGWHHQDSGGIGLGKYVMGDPDVLEFRRKLAI